MTHTSTANDPSSPPPPSPEDPHEVAKRQREREEMLDYIRWASDGGNNLD